MELGDMATWAGVIGSVVFSSTALWLSWVSRQEAKRSADAAERSAAAAERQIALAEEEAARYVAPWQVF